jgi:DNA polymerase-1
MQTQPAPLLIVDGDNMAHRAYHSTPKTLTGKGGFPINAIIGFFNRLLLVLKKEQPRAVFVAWDTLGVPTYRDALWPTYQGGRVFDPEIKQQLGVLPELCQAFGFGTAQHPGYEADDLIASATSLELASGGQCLILTSDKDSFQLVNDRVLILCPKKGAVDLDRVGPEQVVERMGVLPEQIPDFKALSGDSSDKIPGLKGIGPQTAAKLLKQYGTLEKILEAWNNPSLAKQALLFKKVVTVQADFPTILPATTPPKWLSGAEALRSLGASTLASRVEKLPQDPKLWA